MRLDLEPFPRTRSTASAATGREPALEATKPSPSPDVVDWLRRNERALTIDPVILGEVRFGILLLPRGKRRTAATALKHGFTVATATPVTSLRRGLRWSPPSFDR